MTTRFVRKYKFWGAILMAAMLISVNCFAQTIAKFNLNDSPGFGAVPATGRQIVIQQQSPWIGNLIFLPLTDTNGVTYYTNLLATTLYNCYIAAPPGRINFQLYNPSAYNGVLDVTNIIANGQSSTYPAGSVSWSIFTSDGRYAINTNYAASNVYPLNANPSNYVNPPQLAFASNAIIAQIPSTNGFVTQSITNGLAPTNYVLTIGLNGSNNVMALSNNIVTYVNTATNGSYQSALNLVVAATNSAASTNFVNTAAAASLQAATNFTLTIGANDTNYTLGASNVLAAKIVGSTNSLATTNYVQAATNGFVTASITNGLATTNQINTLGSNGTNFTVATSNSLQASIVLSTNGLASTNYVNGATNGLSQTSYVLSIGANGTNFTTATSNALQTAINNATNSGVTALLATNISIGITTAGTNGLWASTTNNVIFKGGNVLSGGNVNTVIGSIGANNNAYPLTLIADAKSVAGFSGEGGVQLVIGSSNNTSLYNPSESFPYYYQSIFGGSSNSINLNDTSAPYNATILGGLQNTMNSFGENLRNVTILGGNGNAFTYSGGATEPSPDNSSIVGGAANTMDARNSVIVGGSGNTMQPRSTTADGDSVILGGTNNLNNGLYSAVLSGKNANVQNDGVTVISDRQSTSLYSATNDALYIRELNGVDINTTNITSYALNIGGSINATAIYIGGTNVTATGNTLSNFTAYAFAVAQAGGVTNQIIAVNGTSSYANANGTNIVNGNSWTNLNGLAFITNYPAGGSGWYVSGTLVLTNANLYPVGGTWVAVAGSGTVPISYFPAASTISSVNTNALATTNYVNTAITAATNGLANTNQIIGMVTNYQTGGVTLGLAGASTGFTNRGAIYSQNTSGGVSVIANTNGFLTYDSGAPLTGLGPLFDSAGNEIADGNGYIGIGMNGSKIQDIQTTNIVGTGLLTPQNVLTNITDGTITVFPVYTNVIIVTGAGFTPSAAVQPYTNDFAGHYYGTSGNGYYITNTAALTLLFSSNNVQLAQIALGQISNTAPQTMTISGGGGGTAPYAFYGTSHNFGDGTITIVPHSLNANALTGSATLINLNVSNQITSSQIALGMKQPAQAWDDFSLVGSNPLLNARVAPSGQPWTGSGVGFSTLGITNNKLSSVSNYYAELSVSGAVTNLAGVFTFTAEPWTSNDVTQASITLIAEGGTALTLSNLIHLTISPTEIGFTMRTNGGGFDIFGTWYYPPLLTDGHRKYSVKMFINTNLNTVTIVDPINNVHVVTNAEATCINPTYGIVQYNGSYLGMWGQWSSFYINSPASPDSEESTAIGRLNDYRDSGIYGTYRQWVNGDSPYTFNTATSGWYRVGIQETGLGTIPIMQGNIKISAVSTVADSTTVAELFLRDDTIVWDSRIDVLNCMQFDGGQIDQIRTSMDTNSFTCAVDIHVANNSSTEVSVQLNGLFTVVSAPVAGATPLNGWNLTRTLTDNQVQLSNLKIDSGSLPASSLTGTVTNQLATGFSTVFTNNAPVNSFSFSPVLGTKYTNTWSARADIDLEYVFSTAGTGDGIMVYNRGIIGSTNQSQTIDTVLYSAYGVTNNFEILDIGTNEWFQVYDASILGASLTVPIAFVHLK